MVAFDWILWTHALLSGFKAQFTTSTSTKYRVYSSNIAGLPQEINHSTVSCGLSVKMMHYGKLASCNESYKQLYDVFSMAKEMSLDSTWLCEYIKALREEQMEYPMWWENIKTPEQVRML